MERSTVAPYCNNPNHILLHKKEKSIAPRTESKNYVLGGMVGFHRVLSLDFTSFSDQTQLTVITATGQSFNFTHLPLINSLLLSLVFRTQQKHYQSQIYCSRPIISVKVLAVVGR